MFKKYLLNETIEADSISKLNMLNGVFFILTLTLMWRQYAHVSTFPTSPIFESLSVIPKQINFILFFVVFISSILTVTYNTLRLVPIILVSFSLLFVLDVNNIYPFTLFHFTVFVVLFFVKRGLINSETALNFVRWFLVGIYFSGAIQKMNPLFEKEVFNWLTVPLISKFSSANYLLISKTYALIPIWEITTTLFLIFNKTRKLGLIFVVIIHVTILFIFSPLYRNFFGPLFPFNIALIFFNLFLFRSYNGNLLTDTITTSKKIITICVLAFSIGLPTIHFFGYGHDFLSYDLYSGKYKYSAFIFNKDYFDNMPEQAKKYAFKTTHKDFYILYLDYWIFSQTYGSLYREEFVLEHYKNYMKTYKTKDANCVFLIHRNGKNEYELL